MSEIGRSFRFADLAFPLRHQDLPDQDPHRGEGDSEGGMDGFDVDHDRACTGKLETGRSARFHGPKRVSRAGHKRWLWGARGSRHRAPILAHWESSASCRQGSGKKSWPTDKLPHPHIFTRSRATPCPPAGVRPPVEKLATCPSVTG